MNPIERLKHAWDVFTYTESKQAQSQYYQNGIGVSYNPSRANYRTYASKNIATSVYNRLAMDAAALSIRHVVVDENRRFKDFIKSGLDECLFLEANIDQTGRAFIQDIVSSMLDEGCIAVVPIETDLDPTVTGSYDIKSMRVGRIVQWFPQSVTVSLYNEATGQREDVTVPKKTTAIIENPLYSVMNEPNSTMQRLLHKLSLMDSMDDEIASGNLNLLVQLPYAVKTEAKQRQAEERRKAMEEQLNGAKYGVAYIDGTESVTQLNRPLENNLLKQVEALTDQLYSELGITKEIMNGVANAEIMNNYYNRTIEPIISAVVNEFNRKFLTKTARTRGQAIMFFMDPFKLVPISELPDVADKFTRNEIMTSNEFRTIIGMKPSNDPAADELRNKNISQSADAVAAKQGKPIDKSSDENEPDKQAEVEPKEAEKVEPEKPTQKIQNKKPKGKKGGKK